MQHEHPHIYIYIYIYIDWLSNAFSQRLNQPNAFENIYVKTRISLPIYVRVYTNTQRIYIFCIIQRVKARAIPCLHQPPTRGDNTVSVAQGSTATPGATKQYLPPDRDWKELYIYIYARSTKSWDCTVRSSSFLMKLVIFKNTFTFGPWCHYALTVNVSWCYVITR